MALKVTGIILAGGMSQRFGSDKAQAMLGDRSMIQRVYDLLKQVCDEVIVSGRCEAEGLPTDTKCISDQVAYGGPMSGIMTVVQAVDTDWLLIMPCDMPLVSRAIINQALNKAHIGKTVTWRYPGQKLQPFPLLLNRKDALEAIKHPGMSMKKFLSQMPLTVIDISPAQLSNFSNINTTQELGNIWHNQHKILA